MFETLFSYPAVLHRHRDGPLAKERAAYLTGLQVRGIPRSTVLQRARDCLRIARDLQAWPPEQRFSHAEVEVLVATWAAERRAAGDARTSRWPRARLRVVAAEFLQALGRLLPVGAPRPVRDADRLEAFLTAQREGRGLAAATCRGWRWQIRRFLVYLNQCSCPLEEVSAAQIDAYLQQAAQRWGRVSLRTAATALRAWFRHGEAQGWGQPGMADAILVPRVYRHEGLPLGPTWDAVTRLLAATEGDTPLALRNHALLRLLAVYGLRSAEVRHLRLQDIDWATERLRLVRSKTGRQDSLPLDPGVGNAIARYLRHGRPPSASPIVFLTVRAPYRALSTGALYDVVRRRLARIAPPPKGRGPHGLRHACARHLIDAGFSLKAVGDHLGHRSPEATRLYTKVDLARLRLVALEDLGGLA